MTDEQLVDQTQLEAMKKKILTAVEQFEGSMKQLVKNSTGMEGQGRTVEAFKGLIEGPVNKKSEGMHQTLRDLKDRLNTIGINTEDGDMQDAKDYQADYA